MIKQARLLWQNNQPLSSEFNDVYFSREGGVEETEYVFLGHNDLPQRWQGQSRFVIGETGFGTGLNFLTTVQHWLATADPAARLYYYSVEKYPLSAEDLAKALGIYSRFSPNLLELLDAYPPAIGGLHRRELFDGRVRLCLVFDDVLPALSQLDLSVDAWYLDGFAPDKNPDMWSDAVFGQVARLSHQHTTLSTYTAAGFVRRGLAAQGFHMTRVAGFGPKREMLKGYLQRPPAHSDSQPWFRLPRFQPAHRRVAVIGAGIAGVSTAHALATRGWQVSLIDEQTRIAGAASGNPWGVVLPRLSRETSAESEFDRAAFVYTVHRLNRLQQDYPQPGWKQTGVAQLPSSERIEKHLTQGGFDPTLAQAIDADQLKACSGLDLNSVALWYPLAGYLSPPALCQALCDDAGDALRLITGRRVARVEYQQAEWHLFDADGQTLLSADALVIAGGHRLHDFAQTATLPVTPARGQVSYLPATAQSKQLRCPLCFNGYLLPSEQGQHVLGASFQPGDSDTAMRTEDHVRNLAALAQQLPDLFPDQPPQQGRAAVRATTPDRLPLVGPVADPDFFYNHYGDLNRGRAGLEYPAGGYLPGLYVNVGHGARGLTSALLCAELLAAQLNNEPAPVYKTVQDALHPARFMIRALKKGKTVIP